MKTTVVNAQEPHALQIILNALQNGALAAFPTDTVYGLGALVDDGRAVEQLYVAKRRPPNKAIPVLIGSSVHLQLIASQPLEYALQLAEIFWPGPLTLVVTRQPSLPQALSHGDSIGIRMPDHPLALRLLTEAGPMAVTSANLSGEPNALSADEVLEQLGGKIAAILDGGICPGGTPSTVVDCTGKGPLILRQGPISIDQIKSALG